MDDAQREAIQRSNAERNLRCRKCGALGLKELDGAQVGGLPGLRYNVCDGCGNAQPITKRPRREKLERGNTK
jgi:hypothetical protein